ncbi:MAG: non-ribosomal peptide synthetase, partial [bacterium]|nr:non-ribosomal peptide synthetase [bacterium]
SFAQERLWLIDRLVDRTTSGGVAYNVPTGLRLTGPLNVAVLAASLDRIIRRHESLRTVFAEVGGRPVQIIAPALELWPSTVDLGALEPAARDAVTRQLCLAEARRPFDLDRGPLMRMLLQRLGPEEHVLVFNVHHIIADGWSMGVLVSELAALYAAGCDERTPPATLPALPVQYADFAVWQRGWLAGELLERELAWWCGQLEGAPRELELPADRPRPAVQSFRGALAPIRLPEEL